ncbi:dentin sialophosphoprotein-like isoform X1 [Cydia fagiglandana]|uniref:dentin sialophosphoprotein-like isoform X1 n=1 Tax=Cydia fagiglandana TaxID=1458189 RepID=UPI002FEE57AB
MRLTGSRAYARPAPTPTMPPGLVELMEGLAKDVLKNNPDNVYEFCAAHMQKLLEIRDGPALPKKPLSLEQKIAYAQEKRRQRSKNRQLQHDGKLLEHPDAKLDHEDKLPMKETPVDTSDLQPVIKEDEFIMKNEVEIFHEPRDEPSEVVNKVFEVSQVEHEAKESVPNITQKLETEGSSEKVTEQVNETIIRVDTNERSAVEANVKSENVAEMDDQSKEIVDLVVQSTEHVKNMPPNEDIFEAQLNDSEPTVRNTVIEVEEKTDSNNGGPVYKEVIRDEFNEVASTLLLASKTITAFSNISDVKATAMEVVEEPEIDRKEVNIDTKHEEILLKEFANQIEPGKKLEDVIEEHKIIKEETTDIQHEESGADNISFKEQVEDITRSDNEHVVEQNYGSLLSKSQDSTNPTVEDININPRDTILQTESSHNENQVLSSTETKTSNTTNSQVSAGVELSENQVLIEETTETSTVHDSVLNKDESHDQEVHKVNYESQADIEVTEVEDKHSEQGPVHSEESVVKDNTTAHDNTTAGIKSNSIHDSKEITEHSAVSGMDLETAAITIQKVFRTFLFSKSRASTFDDTINENSLGEDMEKKDFQDEPEYALTTNLNTERRTLGISRMDTVLQTVNEEKSLSLSDESSLSSAATTIQAHVRGFLVRNRLASNKTASSSSLVNSDGQSTSLDGDVNEPKKTILNIHIVPERGQFMSRDESLLTSIDLPLDNSPPSSINLHPLGYDKSERRKQLKREDAVQSISPPSNNSGKQSEEVDSVKETLNDSEDLDGKEEHQVVSVNNQDKPHEADTESCDTTLTISSTAETVIDADNYNPREVLSSPEHNLESDNKNHEVLTSSDEMDVVTPSTIAAKTPSVDTENDDKPKLVHSGEFHDIVVQTQVKRSEASVVREFKNVLVYFLIWDKT